MRPRPRVSRPGPDGDRVRRHHRRGSTHGARRSAAGSSRPGASRSRRRSPWPPVSEAAARTRPSRLRLANELLPEPLGPSDLAALAATIGADVPFFLTSGAQLGSGDGSSLAGLDLPCDYAVVLLLPADAVKTSTRDVYRAFDVRNGADGYRRAPRSASQGAREPSALLEISPCCRRTTSRALRSRSGFASLVPSEPTSAVPVPASTASSTIAPPPTRRRRRCVRRARHGSRSPPEHPRRAPQGASARLPYGYVRFRRRAW